MFQGKVQLYILAVIDGSPHPCNDISRALPDVICMDDESEILLKLLDMVSDYSQCGADIKRAALPIHWDEDGRLTMG
jgi:hypothetical protein